MRADDPNEDVFPDESSNNQKDKPLNEVANK